MPGQDRHIILGIHVTDRNRQVGELQDVLSRFGVCIKTRLGLHEVAPGFSSTAGVIILELLDNEPKRQELMAQLENIAGIETQEMIFDH